MMPETPETQTPAVVEEPAGGGVIEEPVVVEEPKVSFKSTFNLSSLRNVLLRGATSHRVLPGLTSANTTPSKKAATTVPGSMLAMARVALWSSALTVAVCLLADPLWMGTKFNSSLTGLIKVLRTTKS